MTAADPGEATQTFTFSIPGLGGGIEISGVSSSGDTQEEAGATEAQQLDLAEYNFGENK